jgi:GNAT superfamily N-acetyltransferase
MTYQVHFRLATLEDVPALQDLIARSARGLSEPYYTREQTEAAIRYVFGVDSQLIRDATYYLAERDGPPIACGGWSRRRSLYGGDQTRKVADDALDPTREPARIRAFFVDPSAARRGLGRSLIELCAAAARDWGFRVLELASTLPGVPLYRATGFTEVEPFDIEFPGGVRLPLVRMRREI